MQTLTRPEETVSLRQPYRTRRPERRRFSPFMLVGMAVTVVIVAAAGVFLFTQANLGSHAADANPNCTLIVPRQPLTAQGLATPYQLVATNPKDGACHEANADQGAFVQATIVDPATGKLFVYNPLVIDRGSQPAIAPTPPKLPAGAVVGIWFGYNGDTLTLAGNNALREGRCVNGINGSPFGQVSYCNAPAFFTAANKTIQAGKTKVPGLGQGKDGLVCPSVRDFSIVDQDQSDNVTTTYLVDANGRTAQATAANTKKLKNPQPLTNGSDNRLVSIALDKVLGCSSWSAPDLADNGTLVTSQALNELQAAAHQAPPIALVPAGDPMVTVDGKLNLNKLNAYRVGVNMAPVKNFNQASTVDYCLNMLFVGPPRILRDSPLTKQAASPDADAANNLFTFLVQRFNASWGEDGLNCQALVKRNSPFIVQTNKDGVAIGVKINNNTKPQNKDNQNKNQNKDNDDNHNHDNNGNQKNQNKANQKDQDDDHQGNQHDQDDDHNYKHNH